MAEAAISLTDEELATQSRAGSLSAFEELVRRYERRIYGFVCQLGCSFRDAREVTQDTFVKAYQSIHQFDARRSFGPWLFTIARRKSIDHRRAALPVTEAAVPEQVDMRDPAELLAGRELKRDLWQLARGCLNRIQYQAVWLRYAEDMDVPEIAQVLGKSRVHVKVMLFRARQVLGREIRKVGAASADSGRHDVLNVRPGSALKSVSLLLL